LKLLNNTKLISILVDDWKIFVEFEKRRKDESTKEHLNKILDQSSQLICDIKKHTEELFLSHYTHCIPDGFDVFDNISLEADIIEHSCHKLIVECNVYSRNDNQFLANSFFAFETKK
jgi:hypothetical protein